MPGRRTVIAGGAGILTLTALGYRAWDRGAFAGASGPAYAPWEQWRGNDLDGKRRPLRAAILAASPHNTQPWLLAMSATAISIYADRTRHLGAFDPFRREMHLGVGCAIENLVRAGRAFGMAIDVQPATGRLEPSPGGEPIVAARMAFGSSQPVRDPLFDAIPRRHTNRGPYREQSIAAERLSAFVDPLAGPEEQEDPRGELVNRLLEHEKFKSAAQMLLQKQQIEDAVLSNPSLKEFMDDEGTEPEIAADVIDLVKTFQQVLERVRTRPVLNVDEETVTVGQMIDYLRRRLSLEYRPIRLKQLLMKVQSRQALVCMFLALLELVRLQAIQVRRDHVFGEVLVRKHAHFDEVMTEQAAIRDDWR